MTENVCAYCNYDDYDVIAKNEFAVILPESQPLSKGHCIILPIRHVNSFFELTEKEHQALSYLLELARNELKMRHQPTGFHVGFNDGEIFDRKEQHFHIHIIPRYQGQNLKLDQRWGIY